MARLETVVVVGAGLAGLRAAEALRQGGFDGRLVMVGEEPHYPYDRPPLSKQVLTGEWGPERVALRDPGRLAALQAEWLLGTRAQALDVAGRQLELSGGARLRFDGAVLATGASPRQLPGAPKDMEGVFSLRTLEDSLAISQALGTGARVVVVGAGFIGSEVASSCRARGAEVTVVEALPTPLAGVLGERMGAACAALHQDHGTRLVLGVGVEAIEGGRRVSGVRLADGSSLPADLVVVGLGVRPNCAWLEGSGLVLADGVVCDQACFAAPGVVAAGDVARWHHRGIGAEVRVEHWTNASDQGVAAAHSLLAGPGVARAYEPVPFFWSDQYGTKIQYVGHSRPDDQVEVVHGSVEERRFVAIYGRDGQLTAALAFGRPRLLMEYRRLLARGATWEEARA
ncbi:MAG TPA: FAD-dependent oxidoreductase, partial [Acidimicrobiales bacterium]|nr:FAD-dependent oxidoreductase [Acidimicrobiales bacterium]